MKDSGSLLKFEHLGYNFFMKALELHREQSYSPHEVGLETPLLFERSKLFVLVLPQNFAMIASNLQAQPGQQIVESQISSIFYDRARVPIWLIEGQLPNGLFFAILRPGIKKNPADIEIVKDEPELHLYLDQEDLLLQGVGTRDRYHPKAITVLARQISEEQRKPSISSDFDATLGVLPVPDNLEGVAFVQFRNLL